MAARGRCTLPEGLPKGFMAVDYLGGQERKNEVGLIFNFSRGEIKTKGGTFPGIKRP